MKKIAILTSGGDAPGMNACIRACVRSAINNGLEVYGVDRGYKGLVDNKIFPMDSHAVCDIIQRGGTILKSARCLEFKNTETRKLAADNLKRLGIEGLVVMGGDGSITGAKKLSDDYGINVVGIPGTIDNDLAYTDFTLGFDTAVNTVLWAINALRDTMTSHDRVSILKVMGRHCGDIALYAGICGGAEYILVPEVPYDLNRIANEIKHNHERGKTASIVVLAEGAGNEQEIKETISSISGADVKFTTLGHVQRGGKPSSYDRILASRLGLAAVEALMDGQSGVCLGVQSNVIVATPFEEVIGKSKNLFAEYEDIIKLLC